MPKQNNCDDLKVESCVDDNGQTISGGDSYDVPTGRYVKHVVNVCETAGSGGGGGSSVDPNLYYTKKEVDALLAALDIPDLDDYYDKTEIDALVADFYSKDEIDQLLKDIEDDYYTKDEVDEKFEELDTSNVSVVGGTFSALDDIKTQQDVNSLLYSMALKPPGSPTTVKTEVSGEEFATDNDLKNQKEVNEFLDERLTTIEETEALDPSFWVTKPEFTDGQAEQDAELKKTRRILELQLLYLAKYGQSCSFPKPLKASNGPPFAGNSEFSASGNVLSFSRGVFEDREGDTVLPEIGNTLRFDGDELDRRWSSVVTDVKGPIKPPTGWHVYEITVEDTIPSDISGASVNTQFTVTICGPNNYVTNDTFEVDQKRQDDAISAERATRGVGEVKVDQTIKELVSKNQREHSDLYAKIDDLAAKPEFDPFPLEEKIETEKAARIADDIKISASLVEEARIRADEDYKLLARINGLDIPEMPEDYEDSGLRELIERESALRATGDAGLQRLIEDNTERISNTNDSIGAERATRADQIGTVNAEVKAETAERKATDSDLQAQIDAIEVPDNFEEIIERLDNDIKVTNQKVDFNAEETVKDQKRQDEANLKLDAVIEAEILALAKREQEDHDDHEQRIEDNKQAIEANIQSIEDNKSLNDDHETRITALESAPPAPPGPPATGGGVEYLGQLKDVNLTPTRSLVSLRANDYATTWQKYVRTDYPQAGAFARTPTGSSDRTLVVNNKARGGVDPTPLLDQIKDGVRLRLQTKIEGQQWDEVCEAEGIIAYSDYQYIKFKTIPKWLAEMTNEPAIDGSATCTVRLADVVPDPIVPDPIDPNPPVDPIDPIDPINPLPIPGDPSIPTKRTDTVLGYDRGTKLWTPHKADYLPLTGGRITGGINFRNGGDSDQFSISPKQSATDYATNIFQRNGGELRLRTTPDKNGDSNYTTHIVLAGGSNPETRIYNVSDPHQPNMATSKGYVDKKINVSLPGAFYKYADHTTASNLTAGEFFLANGNIYMHPTCLGGQDMSMDQSSTFDAIIRISNADTGIMIKSFKCSVNTDNGSNKYVRGTGSTVYANRFTPAAGNEYIISVPGWI